MEDKKKKICTCTDECASGYNPNCTCEYEECHCSELLGDE